MCWLPQPPEKGLAFWSVRGAFGVYGFFSKLEDQAQAF